MPKRGANESSFEGLRGPKTFFEAKCLKPFFKSVLSTEGGEHIFEKKAMRMISKSVYWAETAQTEQ